MWCILKSPICGIQFIVCNNVVVRTNRTSQSWSALLTSCYLSDVCACVYVQPSKINNTEVRLYAYKSTNQLFIILIRSIFPNVWFESIPMIWLGKKEFISKAYNLLKLKSKNERTRTKEKKNDKRKKSAIKKCRMIWLIRLFCTLADGTTKQKIVFHFFFELSRSGRCQTAKIDWSLWKINDEIFEHNSESVTRRHICNTEFFSHVSVLLLVVPSLLSSRSEKWRMCCLVIFNVGSNFC